MIGRALGRGLADATRRPGLVALLWMWNLALAAVLVLPFLAWTFSASSRSPVTDALLDGLDLGVVASLVAAEPGAALLLFAGAAGLALLALVSGAFVSGGILEVVTGEGDDRPLAHRFFRGAGHFFGRFFRLLLLAAATALPVLALVAVALNAATQPMSESGSEPAALWATLIVQAGLGLAAAWFILALDYARAATVLSGTRSMFRTWLRSLAFVVRHLPGVAGIALLPGLGVAAAVGLTIAYDLAANGRTWALILGTILVHEAMLLVRTAVRVGQMSAQAEYWRSVRPAAVEAISPVAPQPATQVSTDDQVVLTDGANGEVTEGRRPTDDFQ